MPRTSTSAHIPAKPEDVFAALSDLTRHPQLAANEDLAIEAVSEGEVGVGSEYRSSVRFMGKDVTAQLRVTEHEPPSRFCYVATDSTGTHTQEIDIRADNGGSLVTRTTTSEMSFMTTLMFNLFGWRMVGKPGMTKWYEKLGAQLETPDS
ncbi:MAG: SRPBCC family protein [Chloroflexi bacterium]|nr:SRPBCC family protein [Chloroflexota bacterium]